MIPGVFALAITKLELKVGKTSGNPYWSIRFQVLTGPPKGDAFFDMMGTDDQKAGVVRRWMILARGCRINRVFDPLSESQVGSLFLNATFVGKVEKQTSGDYINWRVKGVRMPDDWTGEQREAIREFKAKLAQNSGDFGDPDDGAGEYEAEGSSDALDDDIPF